MSHRPVHAPNLPRPVGPYSPGMGFERLVFVSGLGGKDPATGAIASDTASQTEQCLRNVERILKAAALPSDGLRVEIDCIAYVP